MNEIANQLINSFSIYSVVDILIMTLIIYKVLGFIRESRAEQLVKGIVLIVVAAFLAEIFNLFTLNWLLNEAMTIGILALIVLFQPELRRGLANMGNNKLVSSNFKTLGEIEENKLIKSLIHAIDNLSVERTGALIVIEKETSLEDIAASGTIINSEVSSQLLENLFYCGSPLHDGAIIIRGDKILCAGCVLPLTENTELPQSLGTRHRAAIGISENSDGIAIVVSEETGIISVAENGKLSRFTNSKKVEEILEALYKSPEPKFNFKLRGKRKGDSKKKEGEENVQK